jgi:hypothetical protein
MRSVFLGLACTAALAAATSAAAQPAPDAVAAVWAQEAQYWARVGAGDEAGYRALFHERFIGWPCGQDSPRPKSWISINTLAMGKDAPVLDERAATGGRHLIVVYYRATDKVAGPNGAPQARVRNFTHTWVRAGHTWQIMGGMCRAASSAP